jgi:PAS domain S-box-containing protein
MSQHPSLYASRAPLSPLSERLLELIPQIVWLADDGGALVRLNSIWQRYTGIVPTSALGENFWRFFHFDDRPALETAWQNGVARQQSWQERGRLQMADGSYEWFEVMAQPVAASAASGDAGSDDVPWLGTISRLAGGMSDPQLLTGQEFLEALCENVSEGLVACNAAGQLVLFNRSAQEFHGLPPEPISLDRWSQFYDLYNATGEQPLATQDVPLIRALKGEKVRAAEMMIQPQGRQARSIVANADPIVDAMGRQLGAVVLMRDITAQKQLEAELVASKLALVAQVAERTAQLAEREAQFRSTFDQSAIGCAHVGLDGYWLRTNQKLCAIVGYTHEELRQKTFQQITHPDDLAEDLAYVKRLLAGAISHYFLEKRYIRSNGAIIWVRITVSLQRQLAESADQRGEPRYFIGMVEDISDRKQLEIQDAANRRALEQAKQVLEERNQELDQFVHIASHDLKAPLRGIANLAEWLEEDLAEKLSSDNREQLGLMRSRVHRMENLIDGLLQYSRVGREDFATSWVDTRELLLEILDSLDPPATFQIQLPEVMPQLQTRRLLLSQVFSNLFSNAIKHHDRDVGHIAVDWAEQDNYYLFTVADDGPGIPPQQRERMFGIFQTLSGHKSASNTGIGLALVKKIIEGGGGSIQFQTGIDRGIRCEFTWPKS